MLLRVEQIAPFPYDIILNELAGYTNSEFVWVQEEPKNMGAWQYVRPRLNTAMRKLWGGEAKGVKYIGRAASASTATASASIHKQEEVELLEYALQGRLDGPEYESS
mmetsp:Transcript_40435/g.128797  ORF Transcript_40435/g.128797 Transcript_40435/m.128797 type:complete len:107 (-) Transcript_40435:105-425(-)